MKKTDNKKYIIPLITITVILLVLSLIIVNSIKTNGYEVNDYNHTISETVNSSKGFDIDGNSFTINDEDEHYITFHHPSDSDLFGIIFGSELYEDTNMTVWEMDPTGYIIDEYIVTLKKGERVLFLNDIKSNTRLISLGLDKDIYVYEVISASRYSDNQFKSFALVGCLVFYMIAFIIVYRLGLFRLPLISLYESIANKFDHFSWKAILKYILGLMIIVLMTFVAVYMLSRINGDIFRLNFKTILIHCSLLVVVAFGMVNRSIFAKKIEIIGFMFILFSCSLYAVLEPASLGISWDDELHFEKASQVSHIIDEKKSFADIDIKFYYQSVALDRVTYSKESANRNNYMYDALDKKGLFIKTDTSHIPISHIVFLPMALGLTFARGLMLPYHICVIFGRLFNALFFALFCYLAMKKLKYGKIVVLLLALIPTISFMGGSYSYDTWLIGLSVLGFSYLFAERQEPDEKMSIASIVIIPLSFYLSNIIKMVYFPLALVALFVSQKKFKTILQSVVYRFLVILSAILPFVAVFRSNVSTSTVGDTRGGEAVNQAAQLQFIKSNVEYVSSVILTFLKDYLNPLVGGEQRLNNLAYNGVIPGFLITLVVVVVGCIIHHEDVDKKSFPIWYRLGVIILYIGIGVMVALTFYAAYTPVGADYIAGCQPRYLLPASFPLLYVLTRIPIKTWVLNKIGEYNVNMVLCLAMFVMNIYCVWRGCVIYY